MKIVIESVPKSKMRYDTLGDWWYEGETLHVRAACADDVGEVSEDEQMLFALHELVEAWLCTKAGVTQAQVDHFDMQVFPKYRPHDGDEPGDHPNAPYRVQHRRAMLIEHLMAQFLGLTDYGTVK